MKFAVIGHPISHSLSPVMHHANFRSLGLDDSYIALDIHPTHFHHIRDIIAEYELDGFNVTIPFKTEIMTYLDEVDDDAGEIGAVNTVKIVNGRWIGYNTDGTGFIESLPEMELDGLNVLLIGAGGASRAIAQAFKTYGAGITVANRTAERMADWPFAVTKIPLTEIDEYAKLADLLINTTPVGMSGFNACSLYDFKSVNPAAIVAEIIYTPSMTPFLLEAERRNLQTINGLGMFVNQGAQSFEIWTGLKADRHIMTKKVQQHL
ncbi:shikimate dehydrogenase [Macrococcus carouselicus]|uniref:Shikimate dehydrogenase (NADP(+)) n=1 Tax=Macrococcus carouselicus TaxID=69969 RepID=A0A9Q8FR32_9STAP|nr:shikimate dehydrogenase [Macrococcus carouselicus]TDM04402.1 shikimate dehydrogenase [Macrococcus carouselicus]